MTSRSCLLLDRSVIPPNMVSGEIVRDASIEHLEELERQWKPLRDELNRQAAIDGVAMEHHHWDWRRKQASILAGRHRVVLVKTGVSFQGIMAVLGYSRTSKQTSHDEVLYIDYLESAPNNIRLLAGHPRFVPIGLLLIREAIELSFDWGFNGRMGLHSLPQSESFYRDRIGCIDLGVDRNYDNLRYFEIDQTLADLIRKRVPQ